MNPERQGRRTLRVTGVSLVITLLAGLLCPDVVAARDFHFGFDDPQVSWKLIRNESAVRISIHDRTNALRFEGAAAEQIQMESNARDEVVIFEHELPASRILDELSVSLAVRASHPGTQMYLRVVLPRMIDPTTGQPLVKHINGESLQESGRWQTLTCKTTDNAIAREQILWRAQHPGVLLDTRDLYIDRIYLRMPISQGISELLIDDLRCGPLVPIATNTAAPRQESVKHVSLRADRLLVDDTPFFPRILPSHGETLDQLKSSRANVIYTDGLLDNETIEAFRLAGMWTTSTPPCLRDGSGEILAASLALNSHQAKVPDGLLFWTLGTRVSKEDRSDMLRWIDQIQGSQPVHPRPIFADISSGVDLYSHDLDFLGISRHVMQTSITLEEYRDYMNRKATIAAPDALRISWIQTDPHSVYKKLRPNALHPVTMEPEQIMLQAYTAIASGCRGIGFWKQTPLSSATEDSSDQPALKERDLAIELVNLELELLETFLATGDSMGNIDVYLTAAGQTPQAPSRTTSMSYHSGAKPANSPPPTTSKTDIQAAVIHCPYGWLILPIWFGRDAQYVPAPLTARECKMIVHGIPETAVALQISPTRADKQSVGRARKAGGLELTLTELDMTSAIFVTTDQNVQAQIERKIAKLREPAARLTLELARAKYLRTKAVINELAAYTSNVNVYNATLNRTIPELLNRCEQKLSSSQFHSARMDAQEVMRICRGIQYEFWSNSVANLSQPPSSLDALCFQTLPDYWRLSDRLKLKESNSLKNVLTSGTFEDPTLMAQEGWERLEEPRPDVTLISELASRQGHNSDFALRLAAFPVEKEHYLNITEPLTRLITPAVDVHAGETVIVEGFIRTPTAVNLSENAFRIYDNQAGSVAALRYTNVDNWTPFRMVRSIHQDSSFFAVFDLSGLGDVLLDDVAIKVVPAPEAVVTSPTPLAPAMEDKTARNPAWDLLKGLPKFTPEKQTP